ncbi:hypothetical protein [Streptomyces sp. NPDC002889]|uniref:hypothetical protein n=1 Tax=Streptomyces sp. NPDC002889 TaxID=3364669 RepID=UPI00368D1179
MRATRIASLSLVGFTALTLSAPAAVADDEVEASAVVPSGFSVSPRTVAPGDTVTLSATECAARTVTVSSGIFDTVTLAEGLPGKARVDPDAKSGADHEVTFACEDRKGTATLTVTGGSGSDTDTAGTHQQPGETKPAEAEPEGAEAEGTKGEEIRPEGTTPELALLEETRPEAAMLEDAERGESAREEGRPEPTKREESTSEVGEREPTKRGETKPDEGKREGDTRGETKPDEGKREENGPGLTKPHGGVRGGEGGSFAGLGPAPAALGYTLVAGALGAGVYLLRRRPIRTGGGSA